MDTRFWPENLKGRYLMEDLGVHGRIILKWSLQKLGADWTYFAHDRGQWRVSVNTIMNICVPKKAGNFSTC
jgi:hypothetical protein